MIITENLLNQLEITVRDFFIKLQTADYDYIWNQLITHEAANLVATMSLPVEMYNAGKIDEMLNIKLGIETSATFEQGLALAFQMDIDQIRTSFFAGLANKFEQIGWYNLKSNSRNAFIEKGFAVFIAETSGTDLVMPLILAEDRYKIDFEALIVFSMFLSPSKIYKIGLRALELGKTSTALTYFEVAASLINPLHRLREILVDHPLAHHMVTEARKLELYDEETSAFMARYQTLKIMSSLDSMTQEINSQEFLEQTFLHYRDIPSISYTEDDSKLLYKMSDADLRLAIARILQNVNPVEALREAKKPHSPAEISDMEVKVTFNGKKVLLCLPFKSGKKIKSPTVPVDIAYQIIRPFMYLPNCVVILITAKPCSQHLMNYIKIASQTQGWLIEVIQDQELICLLKANGLLNP